MGFYYDKDLIKKNLTVDQIYDLLYLWGGHPEYSKNGLIAQTICHNEPEMGSRKLYYYNNTQLFKCYSGCSEPSFDIFELCIKVKKQQSNLQWELYDAMDFIVNYFNLLGVSKENEELELKDWKFFKKHRIEQLHTFNKVELPSYDSKILRSFKYPRILSWEQEGIQDKSIKSNQIGYYPGKEQITIPHFDINNRLIGIRGRYLSAEMAEKYGKYRPIVVNNCLYTHPLSMNLYHLNRSKENIKKAKVAIIFESEKSTLIYESYYGHENDISVACCGSSISSYQMYLLQSLGCQEVIVAFDRDFEEINDDRFRQLKFKLINIYNKYNKMMRVSAIFDKHMILPKKASPIDVSKEVFETLLKNRIIPKK